MNALLSVIIKEFLQIRRDRAMIPILFVAPIIQLLAFGYAVNTDVDNVPMVLVDQDRSRESRALVDRFLESGYFDLVGTEDSVGAIDRWLLEGRAQTALVIGAGYGRAIAAGRSPRLQVIADGSDSSSAMIGLGYSARIIAARNNDIARAQLSKMLGSAAISATDRIELVPRVWYNPDLKSRWFYVPAVLALLLMVMTMLLSSMGVVREKEIGTMEQIIVTPIRPWQLIVGKLLPFGIIGLFILLVVVSVTVFYFKIPLRGSLIVLILLSMLFLLTTLGFGLLVSTIVRTQQQAMLTSAFVLMMPMIYLSGLLFPIENMPRAMQIITYAIPLRYYAIILRGVFLKGSGIAVLWPEALCLLGFGVAVISLAAARFQKRLD